MSDVGQPVPPDVVQPWVTAAHMSRIAMYMLRDVRDPMDGTAMAVDDAGYPWEKCSAWTRSALEAAIDHLIVWANIVAPQTVYEGMAVTNPPRAYYTLARAALESGAQAVWVLDQDTSEERVQRHLRLLYHDLRQMALALELDDDHRVPGTRERMQLLAARVNDADRVEDIRKGEPKYSAMVRECASAIDAEPAVLEGLWRKASAAAHGKNWFQHVAYTIVPGEEYEPGYFRAAMHPDPRGITESMTAAARLTLHGVERFITLAGHDLEERRSSAMTKLVAETPVEFTRGGDSTP